MALPVEQIMSQLQRGDCEDIKEEDDIAEGPELEEELGNEELFKDTKLEIIEGERDRCNWLVIDDVHICFLRKDKGTKARRLNYSRLYWPFLFHHYKPDKTRVMPASLSLNLPGYCHQSLIERSCSNMFFSCSKSWHCQIRNIIRDGGSTAM